MTAKQRGEAAVTEERAGNGKQSGKTDGRSACREREAGQKTAVTGEERAGNGEQRGEAAVTEKRAGNGEVRL